MSTELTVQEMFWSAADRLKNVGWCQGMFVSEDGEECLEQLILSLFELRGEDYILDRQHLMMIDRVLALNYAEYIHDLAVAHDFAKQGDTNDEIIEQAIFAWNDRPGRKPEEVIEVLELAGDLVQAEYWEYYERQLDAGVSLEHILRPAQMRMLATA